MIAVGGDRGTPVLIRDIGSVTLGPDMRRGIAELNGQGEVVSGIVVMRHGENALNLIDRVKQKIKEIEPSLPPGVKIVTTYDRSDLILRSIATLKEKLIEEGLIVSVVIIIFLFHMPSALVVIITLPDRDHHLFYRNVFPEPDFEHHVAWRDRDRNRRDGRCRHHHGGERAQTAGALGRMRAARQSNRGSHRRCKRSRQASVLLASHYHGFVSADFYARGPGRATLQTAGIHENFAMFFAAFLSITLAPVLMLLLIRGRIRPEARNPVNRFLIALYMPVIHSVLRFQENHHRSRDCGADPYDSRFYAARLRVHATAQRGHDLLHANDVARNFSDTIFEAAADARPHLKDLSRGSMGSW